MAISPEDEYGAQVDTSDPTGYPHGQARNITSPGDGTGTPLEKKWVTDLWGWEQALLTEAGAIEPSGTPDKVGASQYLEALERLFAPTFIEVTANVTIDLANFPWAKWVRLKVAGGGGAGGNGTNTRGAGGGGSGYPNEAWIDISAGGELVFEIGAGGNPAGTGIGGFTRVRYVPPSGPQVSVIALGGLPGVATDPDDGGRGYSGGGAAGAAGGFMGSAGSSSTTGAGGAGYRDFLYSGHGVESGAAAGADGDTTDSGGGGGAAGHWLGVSASDGGPGSSGIGIGGGGTGGTGVGAGGGGGGRGGSVGGDGGAGARGGALVWLSRSRLAA